MILPHTGVTEARTVAERIRAQVSELSAIEPGLSVAVSIGVASFPGNGADNDAILGAADAALLEAKVRGRNRVHTYGDAEPAKPPHETPLAALGYRFAQRAGLSVEEATALAAALHVVESSRSSPDLRVAGAKSNEPGGPAPMFTQLFSALLYGTERWDGRGYPEGLRGESIPRVARAFAVLRAYADGGPEPGAQIRAQSGKQFDPRMVNRLLTFLSEEARRWNPLDDVAGGRGA